MQVWHLGIYKFCIYLSDIMRLLGTVDHPSNPYQERYSHSEPQNVTKNPRRCIRCHESSVFLVRVVPPKNQEPGQWLADGFDAVLDKGTFDAISLSSETDQQGRRICETYRHRITPLIRPGQFFIITSCNWTRDELLNWFVAADGQLDFFDEAKYPTFTFGGHQGQSVCTLIFKRRSQAN